MESLRKIPSSYHYENIARMSTHRPIHRGAPTVDTPDEGPARPDPEEIPLGQRLLERPFLLLALGILIMAVFFTGWGLYEITSLTPAPLP